MKNGSKSNINLENNLEKNPNNNLIKNNGTKISKRNRKKTTVTIDEELDLKFRKIAASKFNFSQGWYTKAVNEAFKEWIDRNEEYFKLD